MLTLKLSCHLRLRLLIIRDLPPDRGSGCPQNRRNAREFLRAGPHKTVFVENGFDVLGVPTVCLRNRVAWNWTVGRFHYRKSWSAPAFCFLSQIQTAGVPLVLTIR